SRPEHHRVREPPALAEPVIGLFGEILDGVLSEEIRCNPRESGLFRHGLRAVLAELRRTPVMATSPGPSSRGEFWRRLRPRAAGTVEAIGLVDGRQRLQCSCGTHLAEAMPQGRHD